jgi:histidinol-phosphate aminotransferase
MHAQIARVTGAEVVEVDRGDDFTLDLDQALAAMSEHRPDVTFICSPNNPTGLVESPGAVAALASADIGLVVVDEAYGQFADWSALRLFDEDRPMVVTRTFSKTWSMAAARLGYLVGPSWLIEQLDKVTLPYHLDAAKQLGGRLALRYVDDMEQRVASVVAERTWLSEQLAGLAVDVFPSGANFVLFRTTAMDAQEVWRGLVERSVLIRDCSSWPRLANCLRVTVGTSEENRMFIAALREVLG